MPEPIAGIGDGIIVQFAPPSVLRQMYGFFELSPAPGPPPPKMRGEKAKRLPLTAGSTARNVSELPLKGRSLQLTPPSVVLRATFVRTVYTMLEFCAST